MISNRRTACVAFVTAAAASTFALGAAPANADTAPVQACGTIQPGPCSETDHFTAQAGLQTPLQPGGATNCPSWITDDFVVLDMSGNGVEHVTINKAQDFWFTTTFSGNGTASPRSIPALVASAWSASSSDRATPRAPTSPRA